LHRGRPPTASGQAADCIGAGWRHAVHFCIWAGIGQV
jgi:hypothetical protein